MKGLGQSIRMQRLLLRMTQEDVAEQANVTRAWLSRVESDEIRRPGFEPIERIARVLGIQPEIWLEKAGYQVVAPADTPESAADFIRQAQAVLAEALRRIENLSNTRQESANDAGADASVRRLSLAVAGGDRF